MGIARQAILLTGGLLLACASAQAQQAPASPADTDPVKMGWMQGRPPPPEKRVLFRDGSFFKFPKTRWSFAHNGELVPMARVSRDWALPGWSYKSQWWVSHNSHGAYNARSIHGQTIYVDPKAEMVIVRFASNPEATNSSFDDISLPAYQAIAERLMRKK
jgi:hypothetical protein